MQLTKSYIFFTCVIVVRITETNKRKKYRNTTIPLADQLFLLIQLLLLTDTHVG